jgi:general secretion pathway protein D
MKFVLPFLYTFLLLSLPLSAQVPAGEDPEQSPPVSSLPSTESSPDLSLGILSDPAELSLIDGLDEPLERLRLRDQDSNMILDMIQMITGRYILRPQNLPQVKITFDSMSVLSKRETLSALESLLAMNGVGISKIDDQFYKAVPASGMNVHVPIWLDGPASGYAPSQRIYIKMFHLDYAPALEVREQLNPFSTPNVGALLVFEKANSILVTDSLLNLQRMEKLLETIDRPIRKEDLGTDFFVWSTKHAGARELESKLKGMIEGSLKPFLGGTTKVDSDERTGQLIIVTREENIETLKFVIETLDAPVKMKTTSKLFKLQHAESKEIQSILDEVIKN